MKHASNLTVTEPSTLLKQAFSKTSLVENGHLHSPGGKIKVGVSLEVSVARVVSTTKHLELGDLADGCLGLSKDLEATWREIVQDEGEWFTDCVVDCPARKFKCHKAILASR